MKNGAKIEKNFDMKKLLFSISIFFTSIVWFFILILVFTSTLNVKG